MMTWPKSFDSMITVARGSMMEYVVELRDVLPTLAHVAGITLTDVQKENLQVENRGLGSGAVRVCCHCVC